MAQNRQIVCEYFERCELAVAWLSGSELVSISVVTLRQAWLILGWVTTVSG